MFQAFEISSKYDTKGNQEKKTQMFQAFEISLKYDTKGNQEACMQNMF